MKRSIMTVIAASTIAALTLAACGDSDTDDDDGGGDSTPGAGETTDGDGDGDGDDVTITLAAWSLATTPEFQVLADSFNEAYPNYTVELREYDAGDDYDIQMIADLSAGTAPDLYILKNLVNFFTYQDGGQLLDVTDVASGLGEGVSGAEFYQVDGTAYAIPYRQDSWYLYYNADLFEEAGVDLPDGTWTWDDYAEAAIAVTEGNDSGAKGAYLHTWQSTTQGFASSQSPGADILSGDYGYFAPYYQRVLDLQDAGAQETFGTATTNSLTYQGQFGRQEAAMLLMGSWYVATLIAQQDSGDADDFTWGLAPAPQYDSSTVDNPVTFGDPTGIGINPAIDDDKLEAAQAFLGFVASEDAAVALAEIGITPAYFSDAVTDAYFAVDGVPGDDLSAFTFSTHDTQPENTVSQYTASLNAVLGDMHSAILSGSQAVDDAVAAAEQRAASEVFN